MNFRNKKELASRALKVGKERVIFVTERLSEIKEAITKQDIKDLHKEGAIRIREVSGRKKVVGRKRKRGPGNIKKKVNTRKRDYVIMTRKLRGYVGNLKERGELSVEESKDIRKKIRNKAFKSKANLKDYIGGLRK
jgi:large subunit ribosomal protein L19e